MPEITFEQAKEFLNNINSEDKVAIIHDVDSDGFCSGILYYDWCKNKNTEVKHFPFEKISKIKDFELKKYNKVIICDLAADYMAEEVESIKDKQIFFADHHPRNTTLPKEVLEFVTVNDGNLPSSRTAGELTELKSWLSLAGTIVDSGQFYPENLEFINKHLKEIGMTFDEFKKNKSDIIRNFIIYFDKDYNKVFKILNKINSVNEILKLKEYSNPVKLEIEKFVDEFKTKSEKLGYINYFYFEPHFSVKVPVIGIISHQDRNGAYIFATPTSDKNYVSLSLRSNAKKENMPELVKAGISGLEDGSGGGHFSAAGGRILAKDIEKFKQNIVDFAKK